MTFQDFDDADTTRACTRKKAYPSEIHAKNSVTAIHRVSPAAEVRPYCCRRCGQWHVGGVPLAERRPDLEDADTRDEWAQEIARRRSRGGRKTRGGRGELYSHRLSRVPRRPRREREEPYR